MNLNEKTLRHFWAKVALPDASGCMLWTGARIKNGYGHMGVAGSHQMAHRIALWLAVGVPTGAANQAAHSCRNKHCVAPAHLRWATPTENAADKNWQGVASVGERHGHAVLTDAQALAIRVEASAGASVGDLSRRYPASQRTIQRLLQGIGYPSAFPKVVA